MMTSAMKKIKQDKGDSEHEEVSAILFKAVRKAFSEKVIFQQRPEKRTEQFKPNKCQGKEHSYLR